MFKNIKLAVIGLFGFSVSLGSIAAPNTVDPNLKSIQQKMLTYMEQHHIHGAAIELYNQGKPSSYYFGYANAAKKVDVNQNTIFEVGSFTKLFTCLLFAEQVDEGHMKLTDNVIRYLPNFSQDAKEKLKNVTLEELATHTAGFPLFEPANVKTNEAVNKFLSQWQATALSGQFWQYSNIGIGLLGYSLSGATHQDYNKLYINKILKPLNMEAIGLEVSPSQQENYAMGYDLKDKEAPRVNMPVFSSAGALKASGRDMLHFLKAALGLPGIPLSIHKAMLLTQTPYVALATMDQGLGWEIRTITTSNQAELLNPPHTMELGPIPAKFLPKSEQKFDGQRLIEKTGTTSGFRAYIGLIPNKKSGIVILTNRHAVDNDIVKLGRDILLNLKS